MKKSGCGVEYTYNVDICDCFPFIIAIGFSAYTNLKILHCSNGSYC